MSEFKKEQFELSDEDLEQVCGGKSDNSHFETVTCGICGGTATYYYSNKGKHYYSCHNVKTYPGDVGHITVYKGLEYFDSYHDEDD